MALKDFRDRWLLANRTGKALVKLYYHHSPAAADYIAGRTALRAVTRIALIPLVFTVKHPLGSVILMILLAGSWLV